MAEIKKGVVSFLLGFVFAYKVMPPLVHVIYWALIVLAYFW